MDAFLSGLLVSGNPWLILVGVGGLFLLQKAGGERLNLSGILKRILGRADGKSEPVVTPKPPDDKKPDRPILDALADLLKRINAQRAEVQAAHAELKKAGIVVSDELVDGK